MAEPIFGSLFGTRTVKTYLPSADALKFLVNKYTPTLDSTTLVGVEIELEGLRVNTAAAFDAPISHYFGNFWQQKEDGSLRDRGGEFVTLVGLDAKLTSAALKYLDGYLEHTYPGATANNRTGVHIHINCQDKTASQIASCLTSYCLFEKSLFGFSGGRVNNHFCVPVRESFNVIPKMLRSVRKDPSDLKTLFQLSRNSPKYLAFNVGALANFGTIELRHAMGTNIPSSIIPWLETIVTLFEYSAKQNYHEYLDRVRALNTNSEYLKLAKEALPNFFLRDQGDTAIIADMTAGCTYLKESLISPEEVGAPRPPVGRGERLLGDNPDEFDDAIVGETGADGEVGPVVDIPPGMVVVEAQDRFWGRVRVNTRNLMIIHYWVQAFIDTRGNFQPAGFRNMLMEAVHRPVRNPEVREDFGPVRINRPTLPPQAPLVDRAEVAEFIARFEEAQQGDAAAGARQVIDALNERANNQVARGLRFPGVRRGARRP